jgi:PAS domain-containing protein
VAHVDLELEFSAPGESDAVEPTTGPPAGAAWSSPTWSDTWPPHPAPTSFGRWADTVFAADEPCLVIDDSMTIVAASASCCALLGLSDQRTAVGRPLLDAGLRLVDFTAARSELAETEVDKIPPLLAVTSGRQARGLLRVHRDNANDTVDAIATPLLLDGKVAGSLTFFAPV